MWTIQNIFGISFNKITDCSKTDLVLVSTKSQIMAEQKMPFKSIDRYARKLAQKGFSWFLVLFWFGFVVVVVLVVVVVVFFCFVLFGFVLFWCYRLFSKATLTLNDCQGHSNWYQKC